MRCHMVIGEPSAGVRIAACILLYSCHVTETAGCYRTLCKALHMAAACPGNCQRACHGASDGHGVLPLGPSLVHSLAAQPVGADRSHVPPRAASARLPICLRQSGLHGYRQNRQQVGRARFGMSLVTTSDRVRNNDMGVRSRNAWAQQANAPAIAISKSRVAPV